MNKTARVALFQRNHETGRYEEAPGLLDLESDQIEKYFKEG